MASDISQLPQQIPSVDLSLYDNPDTKKKLAQEIFSAFQTYGFVYLFNHGLGEELREKAFQESKAFFAQPTEKKLALGWETPEANRGYSALGREHLDLTKPIDVKESFELGNETSTVFRNPWPPVDDFPNFKTTTLSLWDTMYEIHVKVMSCIAIALDQKEDYFVQFINNKENNLRMLHYPPLAKAQKMLPGQQRAGAHSDYGSITLLLNDEHGGLEVLHPDGKSWISAPPLPGAIIVNVGDLLQQWSNDKLHSTIHRVVLPEQGEAPMTSPRYSIAYFCNPNPDAIVECLPGCGDPKYPPIRAADHLIAKLSATY